MTARLIPSVFLFVCLIVWGDAFADEPRIGVFGDSGGNTCNIADVSPGLISVYVVVGASPGVRTARFAAPMPGCMVGATYLSDTPVYPLTAGDSQAGVTVDLDECTDYALVLVINYFCQGTSTPCCDYPVVADPSIASQEIEMTDCEGETIFGESGTSRVNADETCPCDYAVYGPTKPNPEDGSVGVTVSPDLSWIFFTNPPVDDVTYDIFFGTDADPPLLVEDHPDSSFAPGLLSTATTYYWKVVAHPSIGGSIGGDVWDFTTTSELAVERSTWGAIKDLYR